jgi:hypothetical protein
MRNAGAEAKSNQCRGIGRRGRFVSEQTQRGNDANQDSQKKRDRRQPETADGGIVA